MTNKNWKQRLALATAFVLVGGSQAIAAVPAAYTTAIEGAVTDATTMGSATLVLLVGLAVVILLGGLAIKWVKGAKRAS